MLAIINVELKLLSLKIKHPESFVSPISPTSESDLYVIPKSKDLGIIGIAEIVIGLSFLGEVVGKDGKAVPLVRLAHGFEVLFNLKFGSIYDKLDAIFMRKPFNLTKTLDALKNAINKEAVPSKFTSLFFVQFNSTHLPKLSPLLSLTLFGVQSLSADC